MFYPGSRDRLKYVARKDFIFVKYYIIFARFFSHDINHVIYIIKYFYF